MTRFGLAATIALAAVLVALGAWLGALLGPAADASDGRPDSPAGSVLRAAGDGMPVVVHKPAVQDLIDGVDGDRVFDELRQLTGETPLCVAEDCRVLPERVTYSENLAFAMEYVVELGQTLGYDVSVEPWLYANIGGDNVFYRKQGTVLPDEEVWFVAHVDGVHCPKSWEDCSAADDNGSGTVAGFEVARLFADTDFLRTVVIMFSTGEEQGMVGVEEYLELMPQDEVDAIHSLINSDMIGYDGDGDRVMELYHDDDPPSMAVARVMADVVDVYDIDLVTRFNAGCG